MQRVSIDLTNLFGEQSEDPAYKHHLLGVNRRVEVSQQNDGVQHQKRQPRDLYVANDNR